MSRARIGLAGGLAITAWLTCPLAAQEPQAGVGSALDRCSLRWQPLEADTRSVTNRDPTGAHVTVLSGRYLWTCGNATMEADSAIKRDGPRQVELLGAVVYEDSIRTLKSERLLYFQLSDFIIAEEDVELVRLTDRSTLLGPRVEFLRAVSGVDAVTTAPGRPTVTFYPANTESPEPFTVESELAIFAGEDEARFYGDAVVERSDLNAQADSAMLTRADGLGVLWGEPWLEAEGIRLEGDSIRFVSQNQELEEIRAIGDGYASGERFEVAAELIDIDLANRVVEQVQAHGEGVSRALSGSHELLGDSIHFVMYGSQIDTAYAIGGAVAVQRDSSWAVPPEPEPADSTAADSTAADSTASDATAADSAAAAQDTAVEAPPADSAQVTADSTAAAAGTETAAAADAAADTTAAGTVADTAGAGTTVADTTEVAEEGDEPAGIELATDGSANWARGDTLVAIFERSEAAVTDSAPAPDPFMQQLVLDGNASAFYRMVRDSTTSRRPSLNYIVARRIQIDFEAGEPAGVEGEHAIGAYLEPREAFGTPSPADSAAVADSASAVADSASAAADSLGAPADTSEVRPDSTAAPPDTVGAPPDTVHRRGQPLSDVQLAARNRQPGRERRMTSGAFPALRPRRSR
ncbi:MAG: hypothetical protein F4Z72_15360 [Gemmatimonadales bacterium]|nr:hypothetical protein [Candidatus Palauibacter irciniicola]MYC18245.1 hypothetical protein [Gemmatimonadales bacterium]